jgi:acetyl esterase/lipase
LAQTDRDAVQVRGDSPLPGPNVEAYKTISETNLKLSIFGPPGHSSEDKRPAIVFFFGGAWISGSPRQFEPQCRYLASRGIVSMTAEYRVASRHQAKIVQCVADAKSAIRWVRVNARRLGVDPDRIAAGGGSAGGHLAACAGVIPGLDESGEDTTVSSVPNTMILFNPPLMLAPRDGRGAVGSGDMRISEERCGIVPVRISPFHHVRPGLPPTIIFHGKADTTVPFSTSEAYAVAAKRAGNRCELVGFNGQGHAFFNLRRGDNRFFVETMRQADRFLASLGYVKGEPTIDALMRFWTK